MLFDVKPILYTPGKQLDFQFTLDLSDVEFSGRFPASHPIEVEGCVRNTADVLELELTARTTLDAVCDRCGKAFAQDKEVTYSCLLAQTLENGDSDEIVLLEDGKVDVGDLARTGSWRLPVSSHARNAVRCTCLTECARSAVLTMAARSRSSSPLPRNKEHACFRREETIFPPYFLPCYPVYRRG